MPEIRSCLESFLSHLDLECGLSQNTLQSYRYDLEQFIQVSQAADLICTVEAIAQKTILTKSESEFEGFKRANRNLAESFIELKTQFACTKIYECKAIF